MQFAPLAMFLLLLRVQLAALAASKKAPKKVPAGMLPRQLPPAGLLNVSGDIWAEAAQYMYPSASTVQCYLVRSAFAPHSPRELADADALEAMHEEVARLCLYSTASLLWTVSEARLPPQSVEYADAHRGDRTGSSAVVAAAYSEEGGDAEQSVQALVKTDLWNAKMRYTLFLDTHALPEDRRCSLAVAGALAKALWLARKALVAVFLVRCPWRLVLYSPLEDDPAKRTVVVAPNNVSAMEQVVTAKFHNFHDKPWRISIYPSHPTLVEVHGGQRHEEHLEQARDVEHVGVDAWVMHTAAHYFNFTARVMYPEDREAHGYSEDGVTGTGTLGAVMSGAAWISFNGRFIKDYNTKMIDFTYPYVLDELCVMVPPSGLIPNYITLFRVFSVGVWALLLATFLATAAAVLYLDRAHGARRRSLSQWRGQPGASDACCAAYSLMFAGSVSQPHAQAREASTMALLTMALLFSLTFMGAFQGLLFKSLTKPQYYPQIDKLETLADSGIVVTTRSQSLSDTFDNNLPRLRDNFRIVPKNWTSPASEAFLIRRNGAYLRQENKALHLMNECPRKYMLGYIVNRNFPYLHEMSLFLLRCMDSGLMQKWLEMTYSAKPAPRSDDDLTLTMSEVEGAFFLLAVGILVSAATLCAELLRHRLRPRRPPPQPRQPPPRPRRTQQPRRTRPRPRGPAQGAHRAWPEPPPPYDGLVRRAASDADLQVVLAARWKYQHHTGQS